MRNRLRDCQQGAAVVEFAIVVILVLLLVFGIVELGRALFKWNSAVDVARRGARTAAIVAMDDRPAIVGTMRATFPDLEDDDIVIEYSPDGVFPGACVAGTCRYVRVSVRYTFRPLVWFLPAEIAMPSLSATYPVEALGVYETP